MDKEVLKYLADHEQAALREFLTRLREQHGNEVVLVSLFLQQFETGRGDYSVERHLWLGELDVQTLAESMF